MYILVLILIYELQVIDMVIFVIIFIGFFGSGKMMLFKCILNEQYGMKIVVIENEFGEENIDNEIFVQDLNEQIIQMSNGCICCMICGDFVCVFGDLVVKKCEGKFDFDCIVIEMIGFVNLGFVV